MQHFLWQQPMAAAVEIGNVIDNLPRLRNAKHGHLIGMQRKRGDNPARAIAHDLGIGIAAKQDMAHQHLDEFRPRLNLVRLLQKVW